MGLSIKKSSWNPDSDPINASPLQQGMWVEFKAIKNSDDKDWEKYIKSDLFKKTYKLVLSEPIELNVETEWTESAGADIAKKVNQIFNSKAIKIFAGAQGSHNAPNDAWTQKTTEIGKPLSIKLKFRIYNQPLIDETNNIKQSYIDMIQFLILMCAPRKQYSLGASIVEPLYAAAEHSKQFFQSLKADDTKVKGMKEPEEPKPDDPPEKKAEYAKEKKEYERRKEQAKMSARASFLESEKNSNSLFSSIFSKIRYNYTLQLKSTIFNFDPEKDKNNNDDVEIDWYIKSFNWKPSTEIKYINNLPYPLWVDFELNLETCCAWPKSWIEKISLH